MHVYVEIHTLPPLSRRADDRIRRCRCRSDSRLDRTKRRSCGTKTSVIGTAKFSSSLNRNFSYFGFTNARRFCQRRSLKLSDLARRWPEADKRCAYAIWSASLREVSHPKTRPSRSQRRSRMVQSRGIRCEGETMAVSVSKKASGLRITRVAFYFIRLYEILRNRVNCD